MTHFTAALELSRSVMCLCVVCVFVCFSGKEMPAAAKVLAQTAMPSPTCCFCGITIKPPRRPLLATEAQLSDAAAYSLTIGKQPRKHALHICSTHFRHPPRSPAPAKARKKMQHSLYDATCAVRLCADSACCCCCCKFFLRDCRCVQQLQQSHHAVRSATSPTPLHCASQHLRAAHRALPASGRSTRDSLFSSGTLSLC
jgi:hypothetical protein